MDNIWKEYAKEYMPEKEFEKVSQIIRETESFAEVTHSFALNSLINVLYSEDKTQVGIRIRTGYQNAFDIAYKNKEPIINVEESGKIDLMFDNKFSIENFIKTAQIALEKFDKLTKEG
ncbi:hypothetical protein ACUXJ9_001413 [Staphylococcus caledonicus]